MSVEYVLVAAQPERTEEVAGFLRGLPGVRGVRRIAYGHFHLLAEIEAPTHLAIQTLIANKVRFHVGVERVDELGDEEEAEPVLHALDSGAA